MNQRSLLLGCALLCAGVNAHAQAHRLKATTLFLWHNAAHVKLDSTVYDYSFGRALTNSESELSGSDWAADNIIDQGYDYNTGQHVSTFKTLQYFDNVDRLTLGYGLDRVNNSWDTLNKTWYHYDNYGMDTLAYAYKNNGNWTLGQRSIYIWSQNGFVTGIFQSWNPNISQYVDQHRVTNTYTAGKLTQKFVEQWDGNAWQPLSRNTYTYVGNNVSVDLGEGYNMGWVNNYRLIYTYDANLDAIEEELQNWVSGAWLNAVRKFSTYDSDHNLTTQIIQHWLNNQWTNSLQRLLTYTTFNMLGSWTNTSWDNSAGQFIPVEDQDAKKLYYYEEFDPASVSGTAKNNTQLQVYPNPASNTININLHAAQQQPFSITIFDATGKSVRHWNEAPTTFYQKQIDVSQLPSGNYFLRIDNRPSEALSFSVIK